MQSGAPDPESLEVFRSLAVRKQSQVDGFVHAVDAIPHHRVAERAEARADLVQAPRVESGVDERDRSGFIRHLPGPENTEFRPTGRESFRRIGGPVCLEMTFAKDPAAGGAPQETARVQVAGRSTLDYSEVLLAHFVSSEGESKRACGRGMATEHDEARGLPIESVGKVRHEFLSPVPSQKSEECVLAVVAGRMDREVAGFVDHEHVVVFVHDQVVFIHGRLGFRLVAKHYLFSRTHPATGPGRPRTDAHLPVADSPEPGGSGEAWVAPCQEHIQSPTLLLWRYREFLFYLLHKKRNQWPLAHPSPESKEDSMKIKRTSRPAWRELLGRKDDFQAIVRLLTEFDERTGRFRRFSDPETHYMRRALAVCDSECLRVFVRSLGGFVYQVAVELRGRAGSVATGWVHEDGIRAERETFSGEARHPVHSITCLTDLYESDCVDSDEEGLSARGRISEALEEVMNERPEGEQEVG